MTQEYGTVQPKMETSEKRESRLIDVCQENCDNEIIRKPCNVSQVNNQISTATDKIMYMTSFLVLQIMN